MGLKMGYCELCGSVYPDGGQSQTIHESGKRHQKSVERHMQAAELPKKTVFVALVSKGEAGYSSVDSDSLKAAFSTFGEVTHVSCGFLQDHAFVEFATEEAVEKAKTAKSLKINEHLTGVIYERRITFQDEHPCSSLDIEEIVQHIKDPTCQGFSTHVDRIAAAMGTTEAEISRRAALCKRFEDLLKLYIIDPTVVQFGSAITGVGTNDSDMDLCLLFKNEYSLMSEFVRDANELLSCPAENFRENLVHPDELRALSRRDQTDVLFRILKEMRREKCGFFKSLYAVSDARCPVIRFSAYDRHLVELSVNNSIGYQKSAYLGALVQSDQSGNLRKLILALRFWAMFNGVFKSEKKKTWNLNSYTVTLMFVTFLQSEGLLPVFAHSQNPEYASDNRVDFAVPPFTLAEVDMRSLFKKFFVFCVENQLDKSVFTLRKGGLVPLAELEGILMNSKPISVLFVQDPIEVSDNVARNVSSKALRTMRHAMMLSLAALKQNADSFAVMLGVLKPSESATSPAPSTPATEGSCRVSGFPESVDDCAMETLMQIILVIVLSCENPALPAKRARFDCDAADLGLFETPRRLWMSRRTLRKKWSAVLDPDEQFPLLIEALVSHSLYSSTKNDCTLKFQAFFEFHGDSLWVGLKLVDGEMVDVVNVAHFIEQMLTKTKDYLASNGCWDLKQFSLEEFQKKYDSILTSKRALVI